MGNIIKKVFPSVQHFTVWRDGKSCASFKNIKRTDGARVQDDAPDPEEDVWPAILQEMKFLIKYHQGQNIEACYPTQYFCNGVQMYKELRITEEDIHLTFAGKSIDFDKVLRIQGKVTRQNTTDPRTFLKMIQELRPCLGYTRAHGQQNVWTIRGQDEEDGHESVCSQKCLRVLPVHTLETTKTCKPCIQTKSYYVQKQKQLEEDELTETLPHQHQELVEILEHIQHFDMLTEDQKLFIKSQVERSKVSDPRLYRWDRR